MSKTTFPLNTSQFNYKAVRLFESGDGRVTTWALKKRTFLFFWRKVMVGSQAQIINACKKKNSITGSNNQSWVIGEKTV